MGQRPRRSSLLFILGICEARGGVRLELSRLQGKEFTGKMISQAESLFSIRISELS